MLFYVLITALFECFVAESDVKIVSLEQGDVKGSKHWNGDFFEFYGVPYASVPKGKDRFKGPLPPKPWEGIFEANIDNIICTQIFYGDEEEFPYGQDDCLVLNLFVPTIANETNQIPVVVYIHSGGFAIGHGNMAKYNYLVRHDVLVVSINYRIGALGFLCLGTEDIPGNAGLKDQVAALRWINKNIKKFGGDPNKVTVAGFSVGAAMAEMLTLSKATKGLIDKVILDSGSSLASWAINRDPIGTANNIAQALGYNKTNNLKELTEFYLNIDSDTLATKSLNFYLKNSTFGFAPCIENVHEGIESFLTESPEDIFRKGANQEVAVLTGFANMEGLSRINKIQEWKDDMEKDFTQFIPTDLLLKDNATKGTVANAIKLYYFKNKFSSEESIVEYINYFSDSMFTYNILKSAKMHAKSNRPVFLYEFSYVGDLSTKHFFMDRVKGASHRDQTSYILDFYSWTANYEDMDIRDRMTAMWADFIKYENPTAYESVLVNYRWPQYNNNSEYLSINNDIKIEKNLLEDRFQFWNKIYNYYNQPQNP